MINFWKLTCKLVKEQRDQYKTENEKLKEEVEHLKEIIRDEEEWKLLESEEK